MFKEVEGVEIFATKMDPDASEKFVEWKDENEADISMMFLNIKSKRDIRIHQAGCIRSTESADGDNTSHPKVCAQGQGKLREFVELNELGQAKRCPSCKVYW